MSRYHAMNGEDSPVVICAEDEPGIVFAMAGRQEDVEEIAAALNGRDDWVQVLAGLGWRFEPVADGWHVSQPGRGFSVWDTTPLAAWERWILVNDGR